MTNLLTTSKKALVIILLYRKRYLLISLKIGNVCRKPLAHHQYDISPNYFAIIQFLFPIDSSYSLEMQHYNNVAHSVFQCLLALCPYNFQCSVCLLRQPPGYDSIRAICQSLPIKKSQIHQNGACAFFCSDPHFVFLLQNSRKHMIKRSCS